MLTFILLCLLIELTPGPNMAYLALLAMDRGRQAGYAAVAGITLGLLTVAIIVAFGVAELVNRHPVYYEAIRWAGVLYLLWLAVCSWRADIEVSPGKLSADQQLRYFRRGLMVNLLNPKAAVFYLTVLPAFIDRAGNIPTQAVMLTIISVSVATAVHFTIVLFASRLYPYVRHAHARHNLRRIFAILLGLVALWLGLST